MTELIDEKVNTLIHSHDETATSTARYVADRMKSKQHGLRTYLGTLDNVLDPIEPGDFAIGCGRPGSMKTSFAMQWMDAHDKDEATRKSNELCVFFTSETLIEKAMMYLISIDTGIPRSAIKRGELTPEQLIKVIGEDKSGARGYAARYAGRNIFFVGKSYYGERRQPILSPAYIEHAIWAIEDWTKQKVRSIWIDYLNRLDKSVYKRETETLAYGAMLDDLKNMTQDNKLQTVLLAQAKQTVDLRDDPMITDADVEHTNSALEVSDFMFGLMRPWKYNGLKASLRPGAEYRGKIIGHALNPVTNRVEYMPSIHEQTNIFRVNKQKDGPAGIDHFYWMDPATCRMIHPDPYTAIQL